MLYQFVKIIARAAIKFYCRDLQINHKELLDSEGPLLLAVNHPNSFLDAIVLATLANKPLYSLARGDAFNGKWISRVLVSLKLLPVYRTSEGVENLAGNYSTFNRCKEIFKQNGTEFETIEGQVRTFLNAKLGELLGTESPTDNLSKEDIQIVREFVKRLKDKQTR